MSFVFYTHPNFMLDRSIAPGAFPIDKIKFPSPLVSVLDNGITIYSVSLGEQPVFKFELSLHAGGIESDMAGLASMTAQLMKRGTNKHDALSINTQFDFHGAFWDVQATLDQATFTVYGLIKHFDALMPMMAEMIKECNFPTSEYEKELAIEIQKNKLNWEKTAYSASQLFRKSLFDQHPYGRSATTESLENISREAIMQFYTKTWSHNRPTIFLSGNIAPKEIEILNKTIGQLSFKFESKAALDPIKFAKNIQLFEKKPEALQSSIRLGKAGITRGNPDYTKFSVLNTVLGGFFGSRLQKNIREEKGYTYGISSSLVPLQKAGYWVVGTDVKNENVAETIQEVKKEMKILCEELITKEELSLVKNYLMGIFTGELTQAFDIAEKIKIIQLEELAPDFYDQFQEQIIHCTPNEIRDLANKYLDPSDLIEVVVGG